MATSGPKLQETLKKYSLDQHKTFLNIEMVSRTDEAEASRLIGQLSKSDDAIFVEYCTDADRIPNFYQEARVYALKLLKQRETELHGDVANLEAKKATITHGFALKANGTMGTDGTTPGATRDTPKKQKQPGKCAIL